MSTEKLKMPPTRTPGWVSGWLIILFIILLGGLFLLFKIWDVEWWGVVVGFIILAATNRLYCHDVKGYHALILLNHFRGKQRVIFQGLHLSLPWETSQKLIDLRVDVKGSMDESYPSLDALMLAKYVYSIRPDITGDDPEGKILLYSFYEVDAIQDFGTALFSQMLSDYYGIKPGADLRNKKTINKEVFGSDAGKQLITDFEEKHACKVSVLLEDSDYDPATQKYRNMVSAAKSFDDAVNHLVTGGMGREKAEKIVKLMNMDNVNETMYTVDVTGLDNLQNISVVGTPPKQSPKKPGGNK